MEKPTMSPEEKEYLCWFFRTEDPTYWTYSLLALAFVCLLVGFMLLGMGAMANKNRKKIAKYKAAAVLLQKRECEELRVISLGDTSTPAMPLAKPASLLPLNGELSECRPGNILLTYKDGNTFSLYPDTAVDIKLIEEDREAEGVEEEEEEELSTTEPQPEEVVEYKD